MKDSLTSRAQDSSAVPFNPTMNKPADFDAYWGKVREEISRTPAAPEVYAIPLRSTDDANCFGVRLTSIGPYRIFAYLSVPHGEGPFPALYFLPRYLSVVEVIPQGDATAKRGRFLTLSIAVRGQRNADQPIAAQFPGLLTAGVTNPSGYIFRGIVADCCRGLEYLLSRPEVDRGRVAAIAPNELPILTAALVPGLTHLVATPALFYAARDLAPRAGDYPLDELTDFARTYPDQADAAWRTLNYFDPRWFAPRVRASTLLWSDADGAPWDREIVAPLATAFSGPVELRESEHSRYKDCLYQETWISRQFGFEDVIVPSAWR
jgi:cephalosporin-C deacetylase